MLNPPSHIPIDESPRTVGRSDESEIRLAYPTVSRQHATVVLRGGELVIEDHDSRYGTFVNGTRIRKTILRPGDRVQFGPDAVYRVDGQVLKLDQSTQGMKLTVCSLSVHRENRTLLRQISFTVEPNQFLGILAPSGTGKSTLLNYLATYLAPEREIVFVDDERDLHDIRDEYRSMLGYVPQQDVIFPDLTVTENLNYAARLRLPHDDQITDEVDRVLELVELTHHREKTARVLSGGQKKRLNVAVELLKKPRLLLLDEPTSGLDPATEAHLMEQLGKISRQGTTVICTTHIMDNVRLFDKVVVLGLRDNTGQLAYSGPPDKLLSEFNCRGYADLYETLNRGGFTPQSPPISARSEDDLSNEGDRSGLRFRESSGVIPLGHSTTPLLRQISGANAHIPMIEQFLLVAQRSITLIFRDLRLLGLIVLQPVLLGWLVCHSQVGELSIVPLLFFFVVLVIWLGLNNSARELVRERSHYLRDRLAGMQPEPYLAAKGVANLLVGIFQIVVLLVVFRILTLFYPEGALREDTRELSTIWFFLVLLGVYLGALGMGLLISTLSKTQEAAIAWLPLLIMPQLLISAVGTGQSEDVFHGRDARPFRPLVVKFGQEEPLPRAVGLLDVASLVCLSRPAMLLLETPTASRDYWKGIWIADLCHLAILIAFTWGVTFFVFRLKEDEWAQLISSS